MLNFYLSFEFRLENFGNTTTIINMHSLTLLITITTIWWLLCFYSKKGDSEAACGATGSWQASKRASVWDRWFIRRWTSTASGYPITKGKRYCTETGFIPFTRLLSSSVGRYRGLEGGEGERTITTCRWPQSSYKTMKVSYTCLMQLVYRLTVYM